ncbi:MAG: DUF6680 family protein [Hyphomicrobiaceae bacterium]
MNSALTIIAIIAGPIAAVWYTRKLDREREHRDRRLLIFRALMGTRGVRLSNDHVTALNLVMVEFYNEVAVTDAFRQYVGHLSRDIPKDDPNFWEEREDLFTKLLQEMGKSLGYNFDGRELSRLRYTPMGWQLDEERDRKIKGLLIDTLEGRRPLPIAATLPANQHNPFPPPPE